MRHPVVALQAQVEVPEVRTDEWVVVEVTAGTDAGAATLDGRLHQGGAERVTLAGTADVLLDDVVGAALAGTPLPDLAAPETWLSEFDLTLRPTGLDLESLAPFVALPEAVSGQLQGEVHLSGSPDAPALEADLALRDGLLGGLPTSADLQVAPDVGGYAISAAAGFGPGRDVRVDGHVPFDLAADPSFEAQLSRPGLDLAVEGGVPLEVVSAWWPELREAHGSVVLTGTVTGALAAPVGNLDTSAADASFELTTPAVAFDQVRFQASVRPDALRLDDLFFRTSLPGSNPDGPSGGTVSGNAAAALDGVKLGAWTGALALDRPWVSGVGDRSLRLGSGAVTLSGTSTDVHLDGAIAVEEARLHLDERFFDRRAARTLPTWVLDRFVQHECMQMSAALAYYTVFSLAPLLVVVIVAVGLVVSPEVASRAVDEELRTLVGPDGAAQILLMVEHVRADRDGSLVARALAITLAAFGATGVMVQLQSALNRIWEVVPDPSRRGVRHFLQKRLLSFAMILAIAFVLLVSLALTAFLTLLAGNVASLLMWRSVLLLRVVDLAVSLLVVTTLFATMFKFLPETRLRWRDVGPGAAVTGGLFTVGKLLIGLALGTTDLVSAYGAASSLAVVLVWVYYSAVILLLGAEFTVAWNARKRTPG
jgi:membrane protein